MAKATPKSETATVTVLAHVMDVVDKDGNLLIAKGQTGPLPKDKADILLRKGLISLPSESTGTTPDIADSAASVGE